MSVQEYAQRLRNTRTFTFDSDCGDQKGGNNNDTGNFDCVIPPFPFPQDVIASRAIFKLKSFFIGGQTDTERASGDTDVDDSGYFIEINGAGINMGVQAKAKSCGSFTQAFPIYNKSGEAKNGTSNIPSLCTNGYL